MKPFAKNVGPMIREARLKLKRSQGELAHLLGYNCKGQIISNIERNCCNAPLWLLPRFSKVLGVPFEDLLSAHLEDVAACEKYDAMRCYNEFLDNADQGNLAIVPIRRKARLADVANLGLLQ